MGIASWRVGVLVGLAGLAASASAAVVPGTVVVMDDDPIDGSTVASLNTPFTNGLGQVGTVIALTDGRRAIMIGNAIVFTSDDALPDVATGGESTMGIGDAGQFIYSPSFNSHDAVYGEAGLIAQATDPAPDFAAGYNTTFHSRPRMLPDGRSFWVAGINDGAGGTSSQSRIVYMRALDGTITGVLRAGDVVDGVTVASSSGIDFDVAMSDNGAHQMYVFDNAVTLATNVAVDGTIVAREAAPTGDGDNWQNFDSTSVNDTGHYAFTGDTDSAAAVDEFIAYDGSIVLREGDAAAGGTISGSLSAMSINNLNQMVFIWVLDGVETLLYAPDASDPRGTSVALLAVGDTITTPDGDFVIDDFNASNAIGPGLDLAEDGMVYAEVDMTSVAGGASLEAIVGVSIGAGPCNAADLAEPYGVLDLADIGAFVSAFINQDLLADLSGDGILDLQDVNLFVQNFVAGCP
ncbi:MAG: hypothetical protein H6810_03775 [Phycisphaeraceae bacterium]|nr:MAG: hypothetical protein H6810_03775 [Phycisphaeraceae bacterium]